jgi:hypothetical protein
MLRIAMRPAGIAVARVRMFWLGMYGPAAVPVNLQDSS